MELMAASSLFGVAILVSTILTMLLALVATPAHALFPYPADANRCDNAGLPLGCTALPGELGGPASCGGLNWKYGSTAACTTDPLVLSNPAELGGVSGMSVDISWRSTTGRSDVVIAVLDSGIEWNNGGAVSDLRKKWYINRGELPMPAGPCGAAPPSDPRDCNGDGVFNVPDYDGDPAVFDTNGNGATDPQDLINLFSDGIDDDADGYVDNISGWDFFQYDNDPYDDVQYGHGTGESRDSAAEADNGGDAGTCPNCMSMPLRVGDSFVADVNGFAQAVIFAVDTGASVVQEALGTYNNTRLGQEAVTYAYRNNVPVMASAADEDAWHHNFPSNYVHTIVTNSIRDFGFDGVVPDSWLYFNGCTNFGGNISVAVPSTSCSSEAVGRSSGVAGLLVSAGRDAVDAGTLEYPLTANEVRQLFTRTADDVNLEGNRVVGFPDTIRYATQAGFDQFTGYGRVNARNAIDDILSGVIPPEAEIDSPAWFSYLDTQRNGAFQVLGRVAAERADGYTYRVQLAYGIQPVESDYVDIVPFGAVQTSPVDGVLATIAPEQIPAPTPEQIARRLAQMPDLSSDYDEFTYTVRVQVIDQPGNLLGEDRRTIFVHHDEELKDGFPVALGDGASSPAIADLDGDGASEIIIGNSDGEVHALRADGSELPGWPVTADPLPLHTGSAAFASGAIEAPRYGAILASVAVGDLDGNGTLEVIAADLEGKLYAWDRLGQRKNGFPVSVNPAYSSSAVLDPSNTVDVAFIGSPVLADLDADGTLDVIAAANDRHIYVWNHLGQSRTGFPMLVVDESRMASIDPVTHKVVPQPGAFRGSKIISSPAVGDIDDDGSLDIVVGTNECYDETPNVAFTNATSQAVAQSGLISPGNSRVYAISKDGTAAASPVLPGWPAKVTMLLPELLPNVGEGVHGSPALADVDGDGTLEVAIFSAAGPAYLLRSDGTSFYGADSQGNYNVMATEGYPPSNSADTPSFPNLGEGAFGDLSGAGALSFAAPAGGLARLLGVALPEQQVNAQDHVSAWNAQTGAFEPAFPRHQDDLQFLTGPSIADVGGTPLPEIVMGSAGYFVQAYDVAGVSPLGWPKFTGGWHVANPAVGDIDGDGLAEVVASVREGNLFVWDTTAPAADGEWPKKRHDLRNTGNYEEPQGLTGTELDEGELDVTASKLSLRPDQVSNDSLSLKAVMTPSAEGDGLDPSTEGLTLTLDGTRFTLPPGTLTPRGNNGWRYSDSSGAGSVPDGITRVIVKRDGEGVLKIVVKGRRADLSEFHGEDDRTITIAIDIGNDHAEEEVAYRRINDQHLRTP